MKYSIEHRRELNSDEIKIIEFLIEKEKPELKDSIKSLKVIGRCGCGKCPGILFGNSFDDTIKTNQPTIADYYGEDENQNLIGVALLGKSQISELEFYSIDGKTNIVEIPKIETLKKFEE